MERKPYVIATAEGSELTAFSPDRSGGAFHASAGVYLNGNPFPGARIHTYRSELDGAWSPNTLRIALSAIDEIGRFRTCAASIADNVQSERAAASDDRNAESLLVSFPFNTPLAEAVVPALAVAGEVIGEATALARATLDEGKLIQYFEFPATTKAACEQYLAYFSQFLRDLGIESTSQIKEEANRVLFSVEPADGKEALATVREALAIYLNLPALLDNQRAAFGDGGIAAMQLQANVQHLQSQLVLAKATMQLQQATINAHERALDAQARTLRLLEDAGSKMAKPSESEPILGDLVSVTPIKGRGVEINLPNLVRRLKRKNTPS